MWSFFTLFHFLFFPLMNYDVTEKKERSICSKICLYMIKMKLHNLMNLKMIVWYASFYVMLYTTLIISLLYHKFAANAHSPKWSLNPWKLDRRCQYQTDFWNLPKIFHQMSNASMESWKLSEIKWNDIPEIVWNDTYECVWHLY